VAANSGGGLARDGSWAGAVAMFRAGCEMWSVGASRRARAWIGFTNLRRPKGTVVD
jgi:hypothetical protein